MNSVKALEIPAKTFWGVVGYVEKQPHFQIGGVVFPDQPGQQRVVALFRIRPKHLDLPTGATVSEVTAAALTRGLGYCPQEVVDQLIKRKSSPERFGTVLVVPMGATHHEQFWVKADGSIGYLRRRMVLPAKKDWFLVMAQPWG